MCAGGAFERRMGSRVYAMGWGVDTNGASNLAEWRSEECMNAHRKHRYN